MCGSGRGNSRQRNHHVAIAGYIPTSQIGWQEVILVRRISFFVRNAALPPPPSDRRLETYDSAIIRDRLNRSMRRRLSDDLETLIRKSCLVGRLDTADELLVTLRNLLDIEGKQFKRDRRIVDGVLEGLTAEIAAARARKTAA
jgi:hypothetical protein